MNHEKHVPAGPGRRGPHGPGGRMMPGEKARDFRGTILRLLAYIGKYKAAVGVVMLFAMAGTLFSVLGPKILGNATTELFNGLVAKVQGTGGIDFDKIGRILLLLLGLYLASAAVTWQGAPSALLTFSMLCTTVALWVHDMRVTRFLYLLNSPPILLANLLLGSYSCAAIEVLALSSFALAVYRYDIRPARQGAAAKP